MGGQEEAEEEESSIDVADFMKFEGGALQDGQIEDEDKDRASDNPEECKGHEDGDVNEYGEHEHAHEHEHPEPKEEETKNEFNMDNLICDFELNIFQRGLIYIIANMYPKWNLIKVFGSIPIGENKLAEIQERIEKG